MGDKNNDGDISMEDIENDIMFADDPAVEMTLYTFDNVVRLIDGKKRGEFPTIIMQVTLNKSTAIGEDLKILKDMDGWAHSKPQVIISYMNFS